MGRWIEEYELMNQDILRQKELLVYLYCSFWNIHIRRPLKSSKVNRIFDTRIATPHTALKNDISFRYKKKLNPCMEILQSSCDRYYLTVGDWFITWAELYYLRFFELEDFVLDTMKSSKIYERLDVFTLAICLGYSYVYKLGLAEEDIIALIRNTDTKVKENLIGRLKNTITFRYHRFYNIHTYALLIKDTKYDR